MHRNMRVLTATLVGLLALAGAAAAQVPDLPTTPTVPSAPGVPTAPAVPAAPSLPSAPAVPTAPSVPAAPGVPDAVHKTCPAATDKASLVCEAGAYPADRYADADASAAHEEAGALVDADASHSAPEAAKDGGFFAWISLSWSSFVEKLGAVLGLAGQGAPETDGGMDLYVGAEGVDLDLAAGDRSFDGSPAGHLDGKTFETVAQANAAKADAQSQAMSAKSAAEAKAKGLLG